MQNDGVTPDELMSIGEDDVTNQETQRTGGTITCRQCGIPKPPSEFSGSSVVCRGCVPFFLSMRQAEVNEVSFTKLISPDFDQRMEELRKSGVPQIVDGVQKASAALGRTSTEITAELIRKLMTGEPVATASGAPIDVKSLTRLVEMLQRAEIKHDETLGKGNPFESADTQELHAVMVDSCVDEMTRNMELRISVIRSLYQRVPTFLQEMMDLIEGEGFDVSDN